MEAWQLELFDDERAFAVAVRGFLEEREAENALLLGALGEETGDPLVRGWFVRAVEGGRTVFAARYRGVNFIVSRGPEGVVEGVAARLAGLGAEFPGVMGRRGRRSGSPRPGHGSGGVKGRSRSTSASTSSRR